MSDDVDEGYGWERLPNTIGHDEDACNRVNGISEDDNCLSNCLHCGTYAYPGDICLVCNASGKTCAEEEWRPNNYGWCEKCGCTGNLGYHCIHCSKDKKKGTFPKVVF